MMVLKMTYYIFKCFNKLYKRNTFINIQNFIDCEKLWFKDIQYDLTSD